MTHLDQLLMHTLNITLFQMEFFVVKCQPFNINDGFYQQLNQMTAN